MPSIPIVSPEMPDSNGGRFQRLDSPRISPVRANPGMYDAQFAAANRLGNAVSDIGELAFRVKNATDSAYIARSQTQMEAAQLDFTNWTKTNPDPSTWQAELDARLTETKQQVQEGAKALSPMAQMRLKGTLADWESGTRQRVQLHATQQSLQIAEASFNDFIAQATLNNDLPAVQAKVSEGVQLGVYDAKAGQRAVAKASRQISMNQANLLIEGDPFDAERVLTENKAEFLSGLNDTERKTLEFRAHKAARDVRSNTMREWASAVRDGFDGKGPMPDREAIMEEAKHQGISPKWVDNLFKVPGAFSEDGYAAARRELLSLDLLHDETGENNARAVAIVTQFKGFAASELGKLVEQKTKPSDPINSPVAKRGEASIKNMFEIGGYGKFKEPSKLDPVTGERIPGQELPGEKQKAEVIMSRNLDLFYDWVRKHPDAKNEEATKFIHSLNTDHATGSASRIIINSGAFGFPPR